MAYYPKPEHPQKQEIENRIVCLRQRINELKKRDCNEENIREISLLSHKVEVAQNRLNGTFGSSVTETFKVEYFNLKD